MISGFGGILDDFNLFKNGNNGYENNRNNQQENNDLNRKSNEVWK